MKQRFHTASTGMVVLLGAGLSEFPSAQGPTASLSGRALPGPLLTNRRGEPWVCAGSACATGPGPELVPQRASHRPLKGNLPGTSQFFSMEITTLDFFCGA